VVDDLARLHLLGVVAVAPVDHLEVAFGVLEDETLLQSDA
jgi:hypothetical protein